MLSVFAQQCKYAVSHAARISIVVFKFTKKTFEPLVLSFVSDNKTIRQDAKAQMKCTCAGNRKTSAARSCRAGLEPAR